ncbi:MAG: 7-carboxy-7-deazaguanine synthase [Saprospiraceae bacterium]|nr:7-carboxy-7-deazaguanine synthase [Saprospiraceae bacterium]
MPVKKIYSIKEIYYTLQGEGGQSGRPAVFCRFSGCNLWTGREEDRHKAICQFCDTDFWGTDGENGGKYTAAELSEAVSALWPKNSTGQPLVVCTGGEPLLQLDELLVSSFHSSHFEVAVETNGTIKVPENVNWICVSPKSGTELIQDSGHELKLVYPQSGFNPRQFIHLDFKHFFLQPMDGPDIKNNIQKTIQYCLENPQWRLSLQTHKLVGLK